MAEKNQIKPATGKLGILTPGMGAVSSTFIAGVHAIRAGLRLPIGSFTQMGHIRLGKRAEERQPLVKNFVPLTELNDIEFGGWDIFTDTTGKDNRIESVEHSGIRTDIFFNTITENVNSKFCPLVAVTCKFT